MSVKNQLELTSEVLLATASVSLAFPASSSDGAAIDVSWGGGGVGTTGAGPRIAGVWKEYGWGHIDSAVFVESSAAMTLSGPIGVYGFRSDTAKWYLLGALNGGAAIATLGANTGNATMIQFCSIFTRLAVGPLTAAAVTPSAGNVTVRACQVRQTVSN